MFKMLSHVKSTILKNSHENICVKNSYECWDNNDIFLLKFLDFNINFITI